MTDFSPELAKKLGQRPHPVGAEQRPGDNTPGKHRGSENLKAPSQARPTAAAAPLQVPVEVREQSKKPKRLQVTTSRVTGRDGKPVIIMTAAPGFAISRVILSDIDPETKRCKPAVITERRRGRPANSQRENGATET